MFLFKFFVVTFSQGPKDSWGFVLRGSSPPFLVDVDSQGIAETAGAVLGDHVLEVSIKNGVFRFDLWFDSGKKVANQKARGFSLSC